jgi:hypothetical protein
VKFSFNRDVHRRDMLLGISGQPSSGGISRFAELDAKRLGVLLDEGFADPEGAQNESPTIAEFHALLLDLPEARAGGYAVSEDRPDYRVSLDELVVDLTHVIPSRRETLREAVARIGASADELETAGDTLRAWWD